jgi:hypothetical protein
MTVSAIDVDGTGACSREQATRFLAGRQSTTHLHPPNYCDRSSDLTQKRSPQPPDTFNPEQPLPELKDLVLSRDGNLVTAQWRGSPKFSVGVLSTFDDEQAFERAAVSMSLAVKPGFKEAEMKACAKEIRSRAEANRVAAGLPSVVT